MSTEQIMAFEISIKDKKKNLTYTVDRAVVFAGTRILHVKTAELDDFYLLYYHNSLIYGDKLKKVKENSFIDRAFRDGIVIESSQMILSALIPGQPVSIPTRSKLFSQLQTRFSPQEIAYIATTLDSFLDQEYLIQLIEKIYFHYRRSGKFMKAYQILQILADFAPSLKSANERLSSREFNSYHEFYDTSDLPSILNKDPLYVELYCFSNRFKPEASQLLEEILRSKESYPEIILLWLEKIKKSPEPKSIEKYTPIALKFVSMKDWIFILGSENINPFYVLPETKLMIDKMIADGENEEAALALFNFIDDLPATFEASLKKLWETLDADFVISHLDHFISIIQKESLEKNQNKSESQIYQLVFNLLKGYDLKTVYNKLLPLKEVLPHSLVIRKLSKMVELLENPDRMMELGDYYAEFQQYDPAIDCYSWEMELKPQDPVPVRKISKMYQNKGMLNEAAAYQKVFAQLKSIQESV